MNPFFLPLRRLSVPALALGCLLSCSRKDEVAPAVPAATGTVQATLTPGGAAGVFTLSAPGFRFRTATPDATAGAATFAGLASGTYYLGVRPATGYVTPDSVALTVRAGASTVKAFVLNRDGRIRGTVTWQLNGTTYTAVTLGGTINAQSLSLSLETPFVGGFGHAVFISLPFLSAGNPRNFAGVGTYELGTAQWPFAGYHHYVPNAYDSYFTGDAGTPAGQVVVSHFDTTARTVAGTFTFTAALAANHSGTASSTQTISNGRFELSY